MTQRQPEARSVALSARIYAAMLRAYPSAFRAEYAEPMVQLFRDRSRAAHLTGGLAALLILWSHTLSDYARTTIEEHASGGIHMTRETVLKLSGWALLVGALSLIMGVFATSRPQYDPYNALSLGIDRYANVAADFLITAGFLLVSLGIAGLLMRYGQAVGRMARAALVVSTTSGLLAAAGIVIGALGIADETAWVMFMLGMTFMFVGLLIFGVSCLRRELMPRWNGLPLLAAVWIPAWMLLGTLWQVLTGNFLELSDAASGALLLASFGSLALLGYALLTSTETISPAASAA
jgi:hypothetical protein